MTHKKETVIWIVNYKCSTGCRSETRVCCCFDYNVINDPLKEWNDCLVIN